MMMCNGLKMCMRALLVACAMRSGVALAVSFIGGDPSAGSGDLAEPTHWNGGIVPTTTDDIIFYSGGTVTASVDVAVKDCEFASGGSIDLNLGSHKLSVSKLLLGVNSSSGNKITLKSGSLDATSSFWIGSVGSCNNSLTLTGDADVRSTSSLSVGYGSACSGNRLLVGTNATLKIEGTYGCLDAGAYGSDNTAEMVGASNVDVNYFGYVGRYVGSKRNRMVVRDVASAAFKAGIVVGGEDGSTGNSLLISNVTELTTGTIYVGYKGACSTGAVHLASGATKLPTVNVGRYATATNSFCLVDGAGISVSRTSPFGTCTIYSDDCSVELRNLTITFTDGSYVTSSQNVQYVIGPGATLSSTFTSYPPLNLRGREGSGVTVDGGTVSFPNSNGSIKLGEGVANGRGNVFTVKNNGQVGLNSMFRIGTDGCRVNVLSGGTLEAGNFYCEANDATITISNATVRALNNVDLPRDKYDYTGWATNNTIRFAGTSPLLTANIIRVSDWKDTETGAYTAAPIFEFAVPESGYDNVPVQANTLIWLRSDRSRLHVDASAYKGSRRWMTLMRAPTLAVADWDQFVSEIPENCRAQLVKVGDNKEVQLQIRQPRGMVLKFR